MNVNLCVSVSTSRLRHRIFRLLFLASVRGIIIIIMSILSMISAQSPMCVSTCKPIHNHACTTMYIRTYVYGMVERSSANTITSPVVIRRKNHFENWKNKKMHVIFLQTLRRSTMCCSSIRATHLLLYSLAMIFSSQHLRRCGACAMSWSDLGDNIVNFD